MKSSLFRLARKQNGSVLGEGERILQHHEFCFGINNTSVMPKTINSICLMLY
jgi:hypothetical protein